MNVHLSLQRRLELLKELKDYFLLNSSEWQQIKQNACYSNSWFTIEFIDLAIKNIVSTFLKEEDLEIFCETYNLKNFTPPQKNIGIVMAGNIPLVGFQDWLCVFLSGFSMKIKLSSKDTVLWKAIFLFLYSQEPALKNELILVDGLMKDCNVFLTMGGNVASQHFETYFSKYPSLIRNQKTSVAILKNEISDEELKKLGDDMCTFFGLGCRNVSKLYVPFDFDLQRLAMAVENYQFLMLMPKYKNNYDYNLTLAMMGKKKYLSHTPLLFVEDTNLFSPLGQVNYEFYEDYQLIKQSLELRSEIQCLVSDESVYFGTTQSPSIFDYPDKKDILLFLKAL